MATLYPLRFLPIFRPYLWGGRRLETVLGKSLGPGDHWAESWEVCDHGADQSIVAFGPMTGVTLTQLVDQHGAELLGRHCPRPQFPLLLKFLDAQQVLSVQVHPNDALAAKRTPPDLGKTEAWVVLQCEPDSLVYAGLKPGIDRDRLAAAIQEGCCEKCLHAFHPSPGDCIFLPAGTVHALGSGILAAEIQQSSDATYRLFDWNRVGPDGQPRPLHIQQGLEAVDFSRGPVTPQRPVPTERPQVRRLVQCDPFVLDRWEFDAPLSAGGDNRCHMIAVLEGAVQIDGDPSESVVSRGGTALLPASAGHVRLSPLGKSVLLDSYLP
jgi:mannose-6-phosphate isomerase